MQFLVYNTTSWFDLLSMEDQINKNLTDKFNGIWKKGDIVEARPNGFWVDSEGNEVRGWRKDIFAVIEITDINESEGRSLVTAQYDGDNFTSVSQYQFDMTQISLDNGYAKLTKATMNLSDKNG